MPADVACKRDVTSDTQRPTPLTPTWGDMRPSCPRTNVWRAEGAENQFDSAVRW